MSCGSIWSIRTRAAPPTLVVEINGQKGEVMLTPGTGDPTLLRPEKGKNRTLRFFCGTSVLKQGANKITLTATKGSWLLYDAHHAGPRLEGGRVLARDDRQPSIFFVEKDGKLQQEFNCYISGVLSDEPVQVEIRTGDDVLANGTLPRPRSAR